MKIIDFFKCGNTFRLYLGADDCDDYWGDDWNDAPYEHNAGQVYQRYIQGYVEFTFPLKYDVCEACYSYFNSPFSKEDMKNRKVPCLTISTEPEIKIYFGDNIDEISKQITELGGFKLLEKGEIENDTMEKIKQAVSDEFKYRAGQGRTNYSMEEVIYIVNEVIDEVNFNKNRVMPQTQFTDVDMQIRIIKGDLQYLSEKVDKLSRLIEEQKIKED